VVVERPVERGCGSLIYVKVYAEGGGGLPNMAVECFREVSGRVSRRAGELREALPGHRIVLVFPERLAPEAARYAGCGDEVWLVSPDGGRVECYAGGYAKARFSADERLALVYLREHLEEEQVKKFYLDLRRTAKKYLHSKLSSVNRLYLWDCLGGDTTEVRRNYSMFKGNVKAVVCILRSDDDPLYFKFKRMFRDVPCQMATKGLVLKKYDLPSNKMHLYFDSVLNLACGLLGKIGACPWLLGKELKGDLYMGVDTRPGKVATFTLVDNRGNYICEARRPVRGSKVEEADMRDAVAQIIMDSLRVLPRDRSVHLVMHRDGDVYPSEERGLEEATISLKQRRLKVSTTLVSVKESTPYRIFKSGEGGLMPCQLAPKPKHNPTKDYTAYPRQEQPAF